MNKIYFDLYFVLINLHIKSFVCNNKNLVKNFKDSLRIIELELGNKINESCINDKENLLNDYNQCEYDLSSSWRLYENKNSIKWSKLNSNIFINHKKLRKTGNLFINITKPEHDGVFICKVEYLCKNIYSNYIDKNIRYNILSKLIIRFKFNNKLLKNLYFYRINCILSDCMKKKYMKDYHKTLFKNSEDYPNIREYFFSFFESCSKDIHIFNMYKNSDLYKSLTWYYPITSLYYLLEEFELSDNVTKLLTSRKRPLNSFSCLDISKIDKVKLCPPPFYFDSKEERCIICQPGSYYNSIKKWCLPCSPGEYSDSTGSLKCKKCPKNLYTNMFGATEKRQCKYEDFEIFQYYVSLGQTINLHCLPPKKIRNIKIKNVKFIEWIKKPKFYLKNKNLSIKMYVKNITVAGIYECKITTISNKIRIFKFMLILIDLNTIRLKITYGILAYSCFYKRPIDYYKKLVDILNKYSKISSYLYISYTCEQNYGEVLLNRRWPNDLVNCTLISHPIKSNVQYCHPNIFKSYFLFGNDFYNLTGRQYRPNIGDNTFYKKLHRISVESKPDKRSNEFYNEDCIEEAYSTGFGYYILKDIDDSNEFNVYARHVLRIIQYDARVKMEYPYLNLTWSPTEWNFALRYCIVRKLFGSLGYDIYRFMSALKSKYEDKLFNEFKNLVVKSPLIVEYDCDKGYEPDEYRLLCIVCLPGYFKETIGRYKCQKCPLNTYQTEYGQEYCKICPNGTFTNSMGSYNLDDCTEEKPEKIINKKPLIEKRVIGNRITKFTINYQTNLDVKFLTPTAKSTISNYKLKILIGLSIAVGIIIIIYIIFFVYVYVNKRKQDKKGIVDYLVNSSFRQPKNDVEDAILVAKSFRNKTSP